ncbi:MAG: CapA family protein [Clostridia bacterium]|nr:CapA family protein [Clostridia bacterium]
MKILFASDYGIGKPDTPYNKDFVESALREAKEAMAAADFRMLNLEKLFLGSGDPISKSGPNIGMPREMIESLKYMKIDTVGLANNHSGDFGGENILYNLNYLKENGISYAGGGKDIDEAYLPAVFEKDGVRVSVIVVCENEFGMADRNTPGAAGFDFFRTVRLIKAEKKTSDYVVVYFHGGNEGNPFPSPLKRETYRYFVEAGADAVVAMHTHCPQGYEYYRGKPIIYSMGNFFFTSSNPNSGSKTNPDNCWWYGYMASLEFRDGKVTFEPIPYKFTSETMEILRGERKENFLRYLDRVSEPIKDEKEIKRLFRGWSLMVGPTYAAFFNYSPEMQGNKKLSRHLKNNMSCEAHNELLVSYMNMCYNGITEEDKKCKEEIRELQFISVD